MNEDDRAIVEVYNSRVPGAKLIYKAQWAVFGVVFVGGIISASINIWLAWEQGTLQVGKTGAPAALAFFSLSSFGALALIGGTIAEIALCKGRIVFFSMLHTSDRTDRSKQILRKAEWQEIKKGNRRWFIGVDKFAAWIKPLLRR